MLLQSLALFRRLELEPSLQQKAVPYLLLELELSPLPVEGRFRLPERVPFRRQASKTLGCSE